MEGRRVGRKKENERILKLSVVAASVVVLLASFVAVVPAGAQEAEVTVSVKAPEYVKEGDIFDVTINISDVTNLNIAQFDLSFDSDVVEVKEVAPGSIDDTEIPISAWNPIDSDTIRVISELPGNMGVNGSGYLAKMTFEVKGGEGDETTLDLSNGLLYSNVMVPKIIPGKEKPDPVAVEIPAKWVSAELKIGEEKKDEEDEEPPEITAFEPPEAAVSSAKGEQITFKVTVDQTVEISWQLNGTEMQRDEGVTEAAYTNTSVAVGTWNLSAIATNTETDLSTTHSWNWSVTPTAPTAPTATTTPTATPTPTNPTEAPGVTPTPTLAPGETPTPTLAGSPTPTSAPGETPTPKATPKPTPTPTQKEPGFEAVFAIAVMLVVAYVLVRSGNDK